MRRNIVVATAACATALAALAVGHPWSVRHEREHRPRHDAPRPGRTWSAAELAVHNRVALEESRKVERRALERRNAKAVSVPGTSWVSLGPTDALHEANDTAIESVDSGRLSSIVPDPRDPNVVYVAAAGGGVWKTFDFLSASGPTWHAITDATPNLSTGALAMDPAAPDTLYFATGDFSDRNPPGNTVQKSTDAGVTWSAPVALGGVYPAPNGRAATVMSIRALAARGDVVIAASDVGLFVSRDAGVTFALVDLPEPGGKVIAEAMWSVVDTGGGHWLVSGVTACDEHAAPPRPRPRGVDPGATCPQGNDGMVWRSDDGVTWTVVGTPATTGIGRIMLAVGDTAQPIHTPVYAFVASVSGRATLGFWRSLDGGATWKDATGTLTNPTKPYTWGDDPTPYQDCASTDVGQGQSWYNQLIVVDPSNPDHVMIGGSLCGARTLDGTSASPHWELVAHWLPDDTAGSTDNGKLPYVHADWHAAAMTVFDGKVRAFAGTDGGIFSSTNLFDAATPPEKVVWSHHNRGLATHLLYSVASGDPVFGNPFLLYTGLQDNGTRYRTDPAHPAAFDEVIGGDGIGAVVHNGARTTYWGSAEYWRAYCQPSKDVDCGTAKGWTWLSPAGFEPGQAEAEAEEDEDEDAAQTAHRGPRRLADDFDPFLIRYADVETDTTGDSVLTHSDEQVFVSEASPPGAPEAFTWKSISLPGPSGTRYYSNVFASRTVPGLYGASGAAGDFPFYVTTTGNTPAVWTEARPVIPAGAGVALDKPSSLDFPPVTPPGKQPGQVFIGAFAGSLMDELHTPPPDDQGHLYRTTDGGQTWTSIVGADPAHRLPNVAINVVKYDPVTPTTIYAGTDLGMYITTDDGARWDRMGEGFPMVTVHDIYVARNQEFIRVATFGRGMWEIYPSASANHGAAGDGDYDRNQRIDWVDLGAMSSRLGVTPATTQAPLYSWLLDLVSAGEGPPVQAIGDDDLGALLAKFGGHP